MKRRILRKIDDQAFRSQSDVIGLFLGNSKCSIVTMMTVRMVEACLECLFIFPLG